MRKFLTAALILAFGAATLRAVGLSGLIISNPGLAYSNRYVFNLSNADVNTVTASAVYSAGSFSTASFGTGSTSAGTLTIASNSLLTAAAATNTITVTGAGSNGDSIVIPKVNAPGAHVLLAGRDWAYGANTTATAASLAAALQTIPWLQVSPSANVITITAPTGAFYNSIPVTTNHSATLTIAHATMTGGVDAPTVYVNGYGFQAGRDYTVGGSASASATALANAINAKSGLSGQVLATPSSNTVGLASKLTGTVANFTLTTSNSSAISVSAATMTGGTNEAWALNSGKITASAHGFTLGQQLLYSVGSGSPVIGGLTDQTTYYAIPVDVNTLELASSLNNAKAGTFITLTSSSTLASAESYTLAPLAFSAGSAGFDWEVSNDGTNWTALNTSSVTYSNGGAGSMSWNLGTLNYTYLSLNVVGPSAGGLNLQVTAQGTYSY